MRIISFSAILCVNLSVFAQKIEQKTVFSPSVFQGYTFAGMGLNSNGDISLVSLSPQLGKIKSDKSESSFGALNSTELVLNDDLSVKDTQREVLSIDPNHKGLKQIYSMTGGVTNVEAEISRSYVSYMNSKHYINSFKPQISKSILTGSRGKGGGLLNYQSWVELTTKTLLINSKTGDCRFKDIVNEPQKEVILAKLNKIVPLDIIDPSISTITLANGTFQSLCFVADEDDSYGYGRIKEYHIITYDKEGYIINNQVKKFEYIRSVTGFLPLLDSKGIVIGSVVFFENCRVPGKNKLKDPIDNKFNLLVLNEKGDFIINSDFQYGKSSSSIVPRMASWNNGILNIINQNEDKLLNIFFEALQFNAAGNEVAVLSSTNLQEVQNGAQLIGNVGNGKSTDTKNIYNTVPLNYFGIDGSGNFYTFLQREIDMSPNQDGKGLKNYGDLFLVRLDNTTKKLSLTVVALQQSDTKAVLNFLTANSKKSHYIVSVANSKDFIMTLEQSKIDFVKITPDASLYPVIGAGNHFLAFKGNVLLCYVNRDMQLEMLKVSLP